MPAYDFTLKFSTTGHNYASNEADVLVERLFANGCDDALIGTGVAGRIAMNFERDAGSAQEAIMSALHDAQSAVPGLELIECAPDLVGLSEIGNILGISRQAARKLLLQSSAPKPIYDGKSALWRLAVVLGWLTSDKKKAVSEELQQVAVEAMRINLEIGKQQLQALEA